MNNVFKNVGGASPPRSLFNLSYEKKFTCDMGQIIPVMCDEVVPGDVFDIGASMVIRFQPLVAPVLHQVDVSVYYFFVPYRLIWNEWEDFITGGSDGTLSPSIPVWEQSTSAMAVGSLWDFFGFPTGLTHGPAPYSSHPIIFPPRAYAFVWNEYFRDETLQSEIDFLNYFGSGTSTVLDLPLYSNWEKDYFTSALTFQQRGTAPAIPIVGHSHAIYDNIPFSNSGAYTNPVGFDNTAGHSFLYTGGSVQAQNAQAMFSNNTVDLATGSISVSDLRLSFQVQKFLERNARAGARYTEFLKSQFAVSPTDNRLDRPEYIGGMKAPVIFSEVLQTSETDTTPQGNLAGHGISVNVTPIGKYRAEEFGLILGVMRIIPKPAYQQGIDRQWLRRTKTDFYFPVFANLSEQAIQRGEIYWQHDPVNDGTTFGYAGAYDEMRTKKNMVCGLFRTTYDYWHLGRQFGTAPLLNPSFIVCDPRKDIFAVPSEPGVLVQFGNIIKALRPMPVIAEPGMIDHG